VIYLNGVNWWAAAHGESLIAESAEIVKANVNVFLDEHVPTSPTIDQDNFPQQMLLAASSDVSIKRVQLKDATLVYEEYTKRSDKQSQLSFNSINATAENVTNIAAEIAANPVARFRASSRFVNTAPLTVDISFDLPKAKKGSFRGDLSIGAMEKEPVNPFSEGMGMVRFTTGQLHTGKAHVAGNNDNVHGNVSIRYTDLHLEPLKAKKNEDGHLKSKKITKKLANALFVKDNNPSRGEFRQPGFSLDRTIEDNFFSFVWKGLKQGLLKTIGVPLTFAAGK
jgi:hypothetical protein